MIHELLLKLGIPTYTFTTYTELKGNATEKIGDQMPPQVGWVYGLSTETDGCLPTDAGKTLIATVQTSLFWLNLKYGATDYVENLRLTNLVFTNSNENKYLPINMPMHSDLKESSYRNPTLINNAHVALTLWYIDKATYNQLVNTGVFYQNGVKK